MKPDTFRTALRAAAALTGIGACTAPTAANPPPVDCVAITDQAFGTDDPYPGQKMAVPQAVVECCNAAMGDEASVVFGKHRWGCCANKTVEPQPASACIPWGPPVPPRMSRGITA